MGFGVNVGRLIQSRYFENEYHEHKKMHDLLEEVMRNPEDEVVIPSDFLDTKYEDRGILIGVIVKITTVMKVLWHRIKSVFSKSYKELYIKAVKKIVAAYDNKSLQIYSIAQKIINNYHKAKETNRQVEDVAVDIKRCKNRLTVVENVMKLVDINDNFLASFRYKNEIEALQNEIKKVDPDFSFDNLFSKNELEGEKTSLQKLHDDLSIKLNELGTVEATYLVNSMEAIDDFKKTTQISPEKLIPNYNEIYSYFYNETPSTEGASDDSVERSEHHIKMMLDIEEKTNCPELKVLWRIVMGNFADLDARIESWSCDEQGNFTLKCDKPLKIWVNADCPGGAVFFLGNNNERILSGKFTDKTISFYEGFDSKVISPLGVVSPQMCSMSYQEASSLLDSSKIIIKGKVSIISHEAIRSFESVKEVWGDKRNTVLDESEEACIEFLKRKNNS